MSKREEAIEAMAVAMRRRFEPDPHKPLTRADVEPWWEDATAAYDAAVAVLSEPARADTN